MAVSRCSRCLGGVSVDTDLEVKLILSSSDTEKETKSGGEIDYETYRGRSLNDYMRGQVNLSLPYKVVCAEDCRGLCSGCGRNLNEERCDCETHPQDSRFAVLKDIKI